MIDSEADRKQENSEIRARELLKAWVTPEQWDQYDQEEKITVSGQSGAVYTLNKWFIVRKLDGGGFCFQPEGSLFLPTADRMLARMIMLLCAEEEAIAVSNML